MILHSSIQAQETNLIVILELHPLKKIVKLFMISVCCFNDPGIAMMNCIDSGKDTNTCASEYDYFLNYNHDFILGLLKTLN